MELFAVIPCGILLCLIWYRHTLTSQAQAAELLRETWSGHRIVELEGPHRVTPNEIAATFANLLGRPVRVEVVPLETWESLFKSQGMRNPTPRIQMLDGFNEGRIEFQGGYAGPRKGNVTLVLRTLIERESKLRPSRRLGRSNRQ